MIFSIFNFIFISIIEILLFTSWTDERTSNKNVKSGTLPDLLEQDAYGKFTQYYYCTYGPSFRTIYLLFIYYYLLLLKLIQ